jgi:hypothetical protein
MSKLQQLSKSTVEDRAQLQRVDTADRECLTPIFDNKYVVALNFPLLESLAQ